MERRNKKNRRVLFLMLSLLTTGTFLTTATFAWFTANKTVAVADIDVNVAAQGGIQVSADGTNWKSIVNIADLTNVATTYPSSVNQIPGTLEPVSTATNVDVNGRMEMYLGTVAQNVGGDNILTATKFTETRNNADGKFVAFDLFFRLESSQQLKLTTNSGVTTPDATDTGIKNGTRVAFVNLGNTAIGTALPTIQALNAGVASTVYLWEPNYNSHTAPAIANALDTYGITVDTNPVPYSGVKAPIASVDDVLLGDATAVASPTFFDSINPDLTTVEGFAANVNTFTLSAGISKVRIYMWIEGQDVDVENTASGGNATFTLQFTIE